VEILKKVLVANRGEIAIRVFRALTELGIPTVGVYAQEDEGSVHRFKADEAYLVGKGKKPIDAYLDIEDLIRIAKDSGADGIHPGYGFLSENIDFARRCQEEGIKFIGPSLEHLDIFGDKIKAKVAAVEADMFHQLKSSVTDFMADFIRHGNARCHFDNFLMAALHGAVTLVKVNDVAMLIP
jgi:pyruvate carboxylase